MVNNIKFISKENNKDTLLQKIEKARKNKKSQLERKAINAKYDPQNDQIIIQFVDGSEFRFNSQLGQGLQSATPEQLAEVEITPSGQGLHWESLDADLRIPDLLQGVYGNQKWMSELKRKKLI
ncbi:DUF2442 domain-containing protein [Euhalothece natronophila Z-M001]|uniref:DUF2442 domain-containing protein n=1 Tax=Euhalothece natronophila Z-M001 TaxID=522448 RepID=A0A5B8NKI5_9CHRO|nr:DUF2442 domain-containing protein [Euhalothece natronophila]QDZ39387.1 DUF2442 domain-containing protein [Euhalothece natronophila Z-M001]